MFIPEYMQKRENYDFEIINFQTLSCNNHKQLHIAYTFPNSFGIQNIRADIHTL